ncbi:hypothetical protein D3C78_981610 [compost metagenome]
MLDAARLSINLATGKLMADAPSPIDWVVISFIPVVEIVDGMDIVNLTVSRIFERSTIPCD